MTQEQYQLQLEPVAFLPSSRSGKLATVAQLIKTGVIPQGQAAGLYEEPDIAHVNRILLAPQRNNERKMQIIGDPKKPLPSFDEWSDLDGALLLCKQYYNRAEDEGAPDVVLTRYREAGDMILAIQAQAKTKAAADAAAMAPPAPAGDPMAGGMPPGMPGGMPPMDPTGGGMPPMSGAPPMAA
jgi:hypothetical protein